MQASEHRKPDSDRAGRRANALVRISQLAVGAELKLQELVAELPLVAHAAHAEAQALLSGIGGDAKRPPADSLGGRGWRWGPY